MLENYIANRDEPNATIHNNIILSKRSQPQKKTHSRISLIKISKAVRHHPPNKKAIAKGISTVAAFGVGSSSS